MENMGFTGNAEHRNDCNPAEWHGRAGVTSESGERERVRAGGGGGEGEGGVNGENHLPLLAGRDGDGNEQGFGYDTGSRHGAGEESERMDNGLVEENGEQESEEESVSVDGDIDEEPPPYRLISEEARREILRGSLSMVGNDLAQVPFGEGMMQRMEERRIKVGLDRDGKPRAPLLSVVIQAPDGALFIGKETPLPFSKTSTTAGPCSTKQPSQLLQHDNWQQNDDGSLRSDEFSADRPQLEDGTCFNEFSEFAPASVGRAPGLSATHILMPMRMDAGMEDENMTAFSNRYQPVGTAEFERQSNPFESDAYLRRKRSFTCLLVVDAVLYMLIFLVNVIHEQYARSSLAKRGDDNPPHVVYMHMPAATADLLLSLFLDVFGLCGAIQNSGSILSMYIAVECIVTIILALRGIKPYLVFRVLIILLAIQLWTYISQVKNISNQGDGAEMTTGSMPRHQAARSFLVSSMRRFRQVVLPNGRRTRDPDAFTPVERRLPPHPPPASAPDEGSAFMVGVSGFEQRVAQVSSFSEGGVVVDGGHTEFITEHGQDRHAGFSTEGPSHPFWPQIRTARHTEQPSYARDGNERSSHDVGRGSSVRTVGSGTNHLSHPFWPPVLHHTPENADHPSHAGIGNEGSSGGVGSESSVQTSVDHATHRDSAIDGERERSVASSILADQAWAYQRSSSSGGQACRFRRHTIETSGPHVHVLLPGPDRNVLGEGNSQQVFWTEGVSGDGLRDQAQGRVPIRAQGDLAGPPGWPHSGAATSYCVLRSQQSDIERVSGREQDSTIVELSIDSRNYQDNVLTGTNQLP